MAVVDIPEGLMESGPICLFEDLQGISPEEVKWILFMKKKSVIEKDYGRAVEFDEAIRYTVFTFTMAWCSLFGYYKGCAFFTMFLYLGRLPASSKF